MIGILLALVLSTGGGSSADALAPYKVDLLTVKVPAAWQSSVEEGTHKFLAPSGDAYFLLDVGTVQTSGMLASVCVDKLVAAMGGKDWERINIGASPAARRMEVDKAEDKGEVITWTYTGCNGHTTWSLLFHIDAKKKERFESVAHKVATSVTYAPPGSKE
jgi:hypothetical protein